MNEGVMGQMNRVETSVHRDAPDQISVAAVARAIRRNAFFIVVVALICGLLAAAHAVTRATTFTAIAWFKPQAQQNQSQAIAGLASQFGLSLPTGGTMTPQAYADLAVSREVLRPVTELPYSYRVGSSTVRGTLIDLYAPRGGAPDQRRDATIALLAQQVNTSVSKTGAVALKVTTSHGELSQQLAVSIMGQIDSLNLETQKGRATPEREFVQQQMAIAENDLSQAENRLAAFLQSNRQIVTPQLQLERDRLARDVTMRQQLYTSLVEAFQRARIDEVRDMPVITVLERPDVPLVPDSRRIPSTTALGLVFGLVLGLFIAFLRDTVRHLRLVAREDDESGEPRFSDTASRSAVRNAGIHSAAT